MTAPNPNAQGQPQKSETPGVDEAEGSRVSERKRDTDRTAHDAERKRLATLQARLALRGVELREVKDDRASLLALWRGWSREFMAIDDAEAWACRIGC